MEDKISLYSQNFELKRLSYALSKANDRIKYLENKLENIEEKHQKEIAVLNKKIAKLDYFKDNEIDETIEHTLDKCSECGGNLKEINVVISDVIDFEIKIKRTRNNVHNYKCCNCKKNITANKTLPRGASYEPHVKAIILSMINNTNIPFNKVVSHISGITNGKINISEGYVMVLQRKSSQALIDFNKQLKKKIISLIIMH